MAKISVFDPGTSEVRSPLIAGITEGLNKLTDILDLETESTIITLINVPISNNDKNRIYQAPNGKRLWLTSPAPVIKKNDSIITEDEDFFEIDYIGGSIAFGKNYTLEDSDVVTAEVTYLTNQSIAMQDNPFSSNDIQTLWDEVE